MNRNAAFGWLVLLLTASGLSAQTTSFTYQGRLHSPDGPVNGSYDFTFNLHGTQTGGAPLTGPVNRNGVGVTNGLFHVPLNFGSTFSGADRWLEIAVRTNGGGSFVTLAPRQWLTSTPYAIQALQAGSAATAVTATSVAPGGVNNAALTVGAVDSSRIQDGSISISDLGVAVASNTFWRLGGNRGIAPANQFLGTLDNQPMELRVNNTRLLRLEPNTIGAFGNVSVSAPSSLSFGATTRQMINLYNADFGIGVQDNTLYQRSGSEFAWHRLGSHSSEQGNPGGGGLNLMRLDSSGTLSVRGNVILDSAGLNEGGPYPGIVFGGGSGETISSKRSAGGNQYGLDFYTGFVPRLSILNGGAVGVGTQTPEDSILDIEGHVHVNDHDVFLRAGADRNHGLGYRWSVGGRGIDGPFIYGFSGGALGVSGPDSATLTWDRNGNAWVNKNLSVGALTIRGGADVAEPFPMKGQEVEPGSVMVIDPDHPGHLMVSERPYDTRVAGIVSGAGGVSPGLSLRQEGVLDEGRNVALSGRVYVKADASDAPIEPGDLLTTGSRPGHAMRVKDSARGTGAILGKAMTGLRDGTGLVLVLVSLQ